MATTQTIPFINGSTAEAFSLPVGTYTFQSTTIPGYTGATMPSFEITPTTTDVALAITASGVLTITVTDENGDNITSGTIKLTDNGSTQYGTTKTIADGRVEFANMPYIAVTGVNFYIDQPTSDPTHDPIVAPLATSMTTATQTVPLENNLKHASVNFTMADANYVGITPLTGDVLVQG